MDPLTLILTALGAGAAAGVKDTASAAIQDAYESLKRLVKMRLADRRDGDLVLARYEQSPDTWEGPLSAELDAAGAVHDADLVAAAQLLMSLTDAAGSQAGKYNVHVSSGKYSEVL